MFYDETDIQPVVDRACSIFGQVARISLKPFVFVSVKTDKFGAVWYGDVDGGYDNVIQLANQFATKLGDYVTVTDLSTDHDIISNLTK